ncbi:hypothetical protein [Nocardia sp. NPDC003726]
MKDWAAVDFAAEWKDYGPFVQGLGAMLGAIFGALIAGYFLTRNSKKTPYEQLESLMNVREDWPDGLDGLETVDRSIANTLAQIRNLEVGAHNLSETAVERQADRYAALQAKRSALLPYRLTLVSLCLTGALFSVQTGVLPVGYWGAAIALGMAITHLQEHRILVQLRDLQEREKPPNTSADPSDGTAEESK